MLQRDMSPIRAMEVTHPKGEGETGIETGSCTVDTYAGKLHIQWDETAAVTTLGQLPVFIDFLKTSGLWDEFVAECPLRYTSNNAPSAVDILGTLLMLSLIHISEPTRPY